MRKKNQQACNKLFPFGRNGLRNLEDAALERFRCCLPPPGGCRLCAAEKQGVLQSSVDWWESVKEELCRQVRQLKMQHN